MILSKPLYDFLGFYFEQLYYHPVKTKAISCCIVAAAGNLASQYISGSKSLAQDSLLAYGIYGLLFGGTIPHYFYGFLERAIPEQVPMAVLKKLLVERLIFSPIYHAFTLYMIARLEGKTHAQATQQVEHLYWPVLSSSWKYLSIIQFLNFQFVPPLLRVLIVNLIGFFWTIYIANKRRQAEMKSGS
ncbi:hypothetical protein PPYR_12448 [Photinus pyralis]|uniref:Peroxisomal membrane protein 2 n=1 Tax=Photinus pyralis TaxID=7054 RepID=A0A5N4AE85_PHOPY|nr:peroxisomal membrane protein 2 [Photinus pyralis]KAB0795609.1 hypothetical protein PPYR_12448 [Photinus pyralis]